MEKGNHALRVYMKISPEDFRKIAVKYNSINI